jgi:hypothetical protein
MSPNAAKIAAVIVARIFKFIPVRILTTKGTKVHEGNLGTLIWR